MTTMVSVEAMEARYRDVLERLEASTLPGERRWQLGKDLESAQRCIEESQKRRKTPERRALYEATELENARAFLDVVERALEREASAHKCRNCGSTVCRNGELVHLKRTCTSEDEARL